MTSPLSPLPAPADAEIAALRKNLRKARIAAREALPATDHAALNARLQQHLDALIATLAPRRLAFCWPWRAEPDLIAWVGHWLAADAGRQAALPVVRTPAAPMEFLRWQPDTPLTTDRHGIPIPAGTEALTPDVLVVPLNVFDRHGFRLGYGGGYFDRTLAALVPAPLTIGVAFELARADTVWPQPHDQPMDWLVTEAGYWRAAAPAA